MDLDTVDAIFKGIILADHLSRQLSLLADRHEAAPQHMRHRSAENEAARLDPGHIVDIALEERPAQLVDRRPETVEIGEQRGDVAELDAGLGIVGDGSDIALDVEAVREGHGY